MVTRVYREGKYPSCHVTSPYLVSCDVTARHEGARAGVKRRALLVRLVSRSFLSHSRGRIQYSIASRHQKSSVQQNHTIRQRPAPPLTVTWYDMHRACLSFIVCTKNPMICTMVHIIRRSLLFLLFFSYIFRRHSDPPITGRAAAAAAASTASGSRSGSGARAGTVTHGLLPTARLDRRRPNSTGSSSYPAPYSSSSSSSSYMRTGTNLAAPTGSSVSSNARRGAGVGGAGGSARGGAVAAQAQGVCVGRGACGRAQMPSSLRLSLSLLVLLLLQYCYCYCCHLVAETRRSIEMAVGG